MTRTNQQFTDDVVRLAAVADSFRRPIIVSPCGSFPRADSGIATIPSEVAGGDAALREPSMGRAPWLQTSPPHPTVAPAVGGGDPFP